MAVDAPTPKRQWRAPFWPLYRWLLRHRDQPILVGPWRGEVGFEVLYWLPFLAKLRADLGLDPAQLIPISRGGAGLWYGTPRAVELYDMRTPQEVRVENRIQYQTRGQMKQTHWTPFDRAVVRDAAETLGLRSYATLHPAWMFQTLAPFWAGQIGLMQLQQRVKFDGIPTLAVDDLTLPEKFVAVRLYFRQTLQASPLVQSFCQHVIRRIAKEMPVVLLHNPHMVDDHYDYLPHDEPNVSILSDLIDITPQNNLAMQSAVLSRAQGFVGTYGGLAQLASRMGKPVVSVYEEWSGTALPHKHLSEALALHQGVPWWVVRIGDLPLFQSVMPQAIAK